MSTPFLLTVAPGDALPIYRQIVEQVKAAIASRLLGPGDQLPSHRDVARDAVVAPLTVKRAYDVLEQEGFVRTQRGKGTFVAEGAEEAAPEADAELQARVRALVRQGRALGMGIGELTEALRAAWREGKEEGA